MFKLFDKSVCVFLILGIYRRASEGTPAGGPSSSCRLDQFQCANGECIAGHFLCDGKAECGDSSDETRLQCLRPEITCHEYAFRCSYGACVDGDAKCNKKDDCLDRSDETLPECTGILNVSSTTGRPDCLLSQFRCGTGQCIDGTSVCDGSPDCADRSDETFTTCELNQCLPATFKCAYGACIDGDKKCDGVRNCADGSDEGEAACRGVTPGGTPGRETTTWRPYPQPPKPWTPTPQVVCPPPPGVLNGSWKLHSSLCPNQNDHCEPREGMPMFPGTQLVYFCDSGYRLTDSEDVYCASGGRWSDIPRCEEIRCQVLDTSSTKADCNLNGQWTSCAVPVLPGTQADLSCRSAYRQEESAWKRNRVTCNTRGLWEPEPIKCVPGPVVINIHVNGTTLTIDSFSTGNCNVTKIVEISGDRVIVYGARDVNDQPDIDVRIG